MKRSLLPVLLGLFALGWSMGFAPASADVGDPAAQKIESFYAVLVDSMKNAKQLGLSGRYQKLQPAVEQTYDLETMTSLAVGPAWTNMSPGEKTALIAAFERLTVANYAKNFDDYHGEKFVVDPNVQTRGSDKLVQSKFVTAKQTIPFNYRMRQAAGSWKVIDVYLNGYVSEAATRRSDFGAALASGGATGLTKQINALADRQMKS